VGSAAGTAMDGSADATAVGAATISAVGSAASAAMGSSACSSTACCSGAEVRCYCSRATSGFRMSSRRIHEVSFQVCRFLECHSLRARFPEDLILTIQGDYMLGISGSPSDEGFVRQTWLHMLLQSRFTFTRNHRKRFHCSPSFAKMAYGRLL